MHEIAESTQARITEETLGELRSRIGKEVRRPRPYIEEITRDAIRHYAQGIGDRNPLWSDREYARSSRFGDVVGVPSMLYACDRIVSGYVGGLPGVHAMFAGTDWEWYEPLRRGDEIVGRSVLHDVVEKQGRFAGRTLQQIYRTEFVRSDGATVARADSWCFRTERDTARGRQKYGGVQAARWSPDELDALAADYAAEEIRGAEPRWFEDVSQGTAVAHVVKGPLTATGVIAYVQGWGSLYIRAHGFANDLSRVTRRLASRTSRACPSRRSACTGIPISRPASAFRPRTTTAPNGSRGSDRSPRTGWATTGSCGS